MARISNPQILTYYNYHFFLKLKSEENAHSPNLSAVESRPKRLLKMIVVSEKCSRETYQQSQSDDLR